MNQGKNQQVCIITGGNSGIGLMSAVGFAQLGYHTFIACRCAIKAEKAVNYIRSSTGNPNVEFLPLDLASLDSVRRFVQLFRHRNLPLHLLVNNAGIFKARGVTKEGFEKIFGINYLGHFLLTNLLLDILKASAPSQIMMVSSDLALRPSSIKWDSFVKKTPLNFWESYALSKLCLLIFAQELTRKLEKVDITVKAIHPGFVQSNITWGHRLSKYLGLGISPEQSGMGLVACVTDVENKDDRELFFNYKQEKMELPPLAKDTKVAEQLWKKSCLWTGYQHNLPKKTQKKTNFPEISSPHSLSINASKLEEITTTILEEVLPKISISTVFYNSLKFLFKLEFGSFFLLLIQLFKQEFNMERHLDSEVVWSICQDQNLLTQLREHLGDHLVLWRSEIWVNYPSQQLIPYWHQDAYPNILRGEGKTVNVYIALTEINELNGFEYIAKVEDNNGVSVKMNDPFSGNPFFNLTKNLEEQAIPVVLRPGEFVLFTDKLIHRSLPNTSGKVRLALTLRVTQPNINIVSRYSSIESKPVLL